MMDAKEKLTRLALLVEEEREEIAPRYDRMTWWDRRDLILKWQGRHGSFVRTVGDVVYLQARRAAIEELAGQGVTFRGGGGT